MKTPRLLLLSSLLTFAVTGCDFDSQCGKDLVKGEDHMCHEPPAAAPEAGAPEAGASDGDAGAEDGAAPQTSSFGKTCSSMAECGGDAPICAAPHLPYCTQIECDPGEANAGACPAGWQCIKVAPNPSVCIKM